MVITTLTNLLTEKSLKEPLKKLLIDNMQVKIYKDPDLGDTGYLAKIYINDTANQLALIIIQFRDGKPDMKLLNTSKQDVYFLHSLLSTTDSTLYSILLELKN